METTLVVDECFFEVVLDESTNTYEAIMLLDKPLPEGISADLSSLKIDEDIYWIKDEVTMEEINEIVVSSNSAVLKDECQTEFFVTDVYKIPSGTIKYDPVIGENGGYQVKLVDKIK